jgi:hypothetical protein
MGAFWVYFYLDKGLPFLGFHIPKNDYRFAVCGTDIR